MYIYFMYQRIRSMFILTSSQPAAYLTCGGCAPPSSLIDSKYIGYASPYTRTKAQDAVCWGCTAATFARRRCRHDVS